MHRGNRSGPCCLRSRYPHVQFVWMQTVSCQSFARNRICCRLDRVGSTHPAFRAAFPSLHRLFPIRLLSLFFHLGVNSSHAVTYSRPKRIMIQIGEFSKIQLLLATEVGCITSALSWNYLNDPRRLSNQKIASPFIFPVTQSPSSNHPYFIKFIPLPADDHFSNAFLHFVHTFQLRPFLNRKIQSTLPEHSLNSPTLN